MAHGPPWLWRWGRRGPGRRPKPRAIRHDLKGMIFAPLDDNGTPITVNPIYILPDEVEALRLVYLLGLTQEEAAQSMGVSRGTLWRALSNGRKKMVQALVERRPLVVTGVK